MKPKNEKPLDPKPDPWTWRMGDMFVLDDRQDALRDDLVATMADALVERFNKENPR